MKNHQKDFHFTNSHILVLVWRGLLVGLVVGIVVSSFRLAISRLTAVFHNLYQGASQSLSNLIILVLILLLSCLLLAKFLQSEPNIKGSGIPHVEGELQGLMDPDWWSILWKKFFAGILSISMGFMLGREGPSIQLGAMTAKGLGKKLGLSRMELHALIASGAAAGLAAAFNAPIAGLLFVVEEVYRQFSRLTWITTLVAALTANFVSLTLFGLTPVLHIELDGPKLPLTQYGLLVVLGIILGLLGWLYEAMTLNLPKFYGWIGRILHLKPAYYSIFALLFILPIGYLWPDLLAGNHHLILDLPSGHLMLGTVVLYLLIRWMGSMVSYGTGLPGGIFLPILTLGSLAGSSIGLTMAELGLLSRDYLSLFIVLGMAGFFGAVSKAPLTAMILVAEMVGSLENLMVMGLVTFTAYLTMDLLKGKPIYEAMLENMQLGEVEVEHDEMVMLELVVTERLGGRRIRDLSLPDHVLITGQNHGGYAQVVKGQTRLQTGASLYVLTPLSKTQQVRQYFVAE
ncbi:ClC family H(+)/Cl(-) exchange transporter [Streptococcus caprae]|uniref:ClC family H(+)/Cl(-) exchange transporter n=1 Tax=Streptococcus caprae TaxID=1640501 RepID=A0ABV8CV67_9STRE